MTTLYFITHPSVDINKNIPTREWTLSEKGIKEAKDLLKFDFWKNIKSVYTSPEKKALQVAELASEKYKLNIMKMDDLVEINRDSTGFLAYPKYMKMVNMFYKRPDKSVKGWESANKATERIFSVVSKIVKQDTNTSIVIIGHGATGTLLACHILGIEPAFTEDPNGTGKYMIVDWDKMEIIQKWSSY